VTSSRPVDGPLAWNVAGLLGDEPGADRTFEIRAATIDLGDDLRLATPIEGRVAEPIAPLDRPDCPGLCVVCGLPLDEGIHDHPDDDIDPRLEALRGFRVDDA
jgi:uncharacterized protein